MNQATGGAVNRLPQRELLRWLALAGWLALLLVIAYGAALSLPFFFDDYVHIPFVDSHSLAEIWRTSGGLAYYRPLSFTIWKILFWVLDRHDPFAQHALNLLLHGINAGLVGWLVGSFAPDRIWLRRLLAATLFLLYPFSYQAVPWAGSLSHLLVTALIVAALVSYQQFRHTGRRVWAVTGLLFSAAAPFAHENGVLIGPLVAAIELTDPASPKRLGRAIGRGVIWSLPALLWLPIWFSAPKAVQTDLSMPSLELLWQNGVYFAQGIAYPVTWVGGWVRRQWGANDLAVAAILAAAALALAAVVQTARRPGSRAILPWLWCGLAVLPAALTLRFDYVINGPRLLMVASVGAAWLWTDVAAIALPQREKRFAARFRWVLISVLLVGLGAQNLSFIRERMAVHQALGNAIEQVVELGSAAARAESQSVVVNFPSWLAPWDAQYAIGHEGVLVWPDYARPGAIVQVHTGIDAVLSFARWDAVRSEIPYHYGVAGRAPDWPALIADRSELFLTRYEDDEWQVVPVGALDGTWQGSGVVARYLDQAGRVVAELLRASAEAQPDDRVLVDLLWRARGVAPDTTVFVHLLKADGTLAAQADGDPFGGLLPLSNWPADMIGRDLRLVPPTSAIAVRVGLYNRLTGERLWAVDRDSVDWPDRGAEITLRSQ